MQAVLHVLTGPEAGRRILIKAGQIARFGRTSWSEFAFPYDHQLADIHFSIETTNDAVALADLSQGKGVSVDGEKTEACQLHSGQKIQAGKMTFVVATERLFESSATGTGPIAVQAKRPAAPASVLASTICESVELSEAAQPLLDETIEVLPFIDKLTGEKLFLDALRVLAAWLDKRKAVWWGAACLELACGDRIQPQAGLIALSRAWAREPTEENRRNALDAAETADTKLPACWLARAAGWSGGSLSPPGLPVVPPDEKLMPQALIGALLLAAVFINPAHCADNYGKFVEQGKELAQTKLEWEEE